MLLPQTTIAQAELIAEKFRDVTASTPISIDLGDGKNLTLEVTVSIGLASTDHIANNASLDALMSEADGALYQAKRKGRNRVVSHRN